MSKRQEAIKVAKQNAAEALDQLPSNPKAMEDYRDNMHDTLAKMDLTPTEVWFAEDAFRRATTNRS